MKRILLTGGNGFIGRNLLEGLKADFQLFAPRRTELDLLEYPALATYIKQNRIEQIIHAAVHVPMMHGEEHEYYNDMRMFLNIEKISSEVEKVLYFGSGAEYDKRFDICMAKEEEIGCSIPTSEYGLAKYTMNLLARASKNMYNLRLFGVFGKYELWEIKFLSNLCCKAVFNLPLTVRSDCYFDFLPVECLVEATRWFIVNPPRFHDYNVCMGRQYRLLELAQMVCGVSGKNLPIQLLSEEKNRDYSASNARLLAEAPELAVCSMKEALGRLYGYYEGNQNLINKDVLMRSR